MTHSFGRLSPIFTNRSELWPTMDSPIVDEEMEIDSEHMAISQQCQRFEREMVWSPIGSSDESENTCEMPSQRQQEPESACDVYESDESYGNDEESIGGDVQPSPDMFADSQEQGAAICVAPKQNSLLSSDVVMCGQKSIAETYRNAGMTFESMECSPARSSVVMASDTVNTKTQDDKIQSTIKSTPLYAKELNDRIRTKLKIYTSNLSQKELSFRNSLPITSTLNYPNPEDCIKHEIPTTSEEVLACRQRQLVARTYREIEDCEHSSPMLSCASRKILKAKRSKSKEPKQSGYVSETNVDNTVKTSFKNQPSFAPKLTQHRNILQAVRPKLTEPKTKDTFSVLHLNEQPSRRALQKYTVNQNNVLKEFILNDDFSKSNPSPFARRILKAKRSKSSEPKTVKEQTSTNQQRSKDVLGGNRTILKARRSKSTDSKALDRSANTDDQEMVHNENALLDEDTDKEVVVSNNFLTDTKLDGMPLKPSQRYSRKIITHFTNKPTLKNQFSKNILQHLQKNLELNQDTYHVGYDIKDEPNSNHLSFGRRSIVHENLPISFETISGNPCEEMQKQLTLKQLSSCFQTINETVVNETNLYNPCNETNNIDSFKRPNDHYQTNFAQRTMSDDETFCSTLDQPKTCALSTQESSAYRIIPHKPIRNRLLESTMFETIPSSSTIDHQTPIAPIHTNPTVLRSDYRQLSHISLQSKSSDRTYCSYAERLIEKTRCDESEPFDLDAAIQKIMHKNLEPLSVDNEPPAASDHPMAGPSSETDMFVESPVAERNIFLSKIEEVVMQFLLDLINCDQEPVSIRLKRINWHGCSFETESQTLSQSGTSTRKTTSRHRIMVIMNVLKDIYCKLRFKESSTARELYYDDPDLIQDMVRLQSAVRDVSNLIGALPWELGILSSSKGLIAGPMSLTLANDEVIDCEGLTGGIILPHLTTGIKSIKTTAELVLLVEKDTVYKQLLSADLSKHIGRPLILITGKGYPDINTRVMLHKIWSFCRLPIYALFDADPHGIEIMLVYRHGSMNMSPFVDHMAVPHIQWIGVRPTEITTLGLNCLQLSGRDKRLVNLMLQRPYITEDIRKELQVLLTGDRKAEIESLASISRSYLTDTYLPERLRTGTGE